MAIHATAGQVFAAFETLGSAFKFGIGKRPGVGSEKRTPSDSEGNSTDDDDQQRKKTKQQAFPQTSHGGTLKVMWRNFRSFSHRLLGQQQVLATRVVAMQDQATFRRSTA
jgi:hypothetical protein